MPSPSFIAPAAGRAGWALRARGAACVRRTRRVARARMSIEQEVSARLTAAMKARDAAALTALRGIRAAFLNALKEGGAGDALSDEAAVAQLRKLAKMRRESIDMFRRGGRDDLADAEARELAVIETWLPRLAGVEQTEAWAKEAIEMTGASRPADMGKVMGVVMKQHKQQVDGNVLRTVVTDMLKSM